jgi:hypothetical protein
VSRRVGDVSPFSALHAVVDGDGSHILVAVAVHEGSHVDDHLAAGLVSDHLAKDSGADRASDPVFFPFEIVEAALVQEMAAGKTDDVFVTFLH